ncbi:MAG: hypothetical protein JOZ78_22995 [Chroococcidiopsidaceae cyanobacterium CP_BM_ER_R8_30]|nr:hypothetical protein [Chroococcidiopsidaceae cyanobacterium CP_BM_ER_R8_30]
MKDFEDFVPQLTDDGSFTFFSADYGELFHSSRGAREEALLKFVQPALLAQVAKKPSLRILDICYGLGYNTAAALTTIWAINPNCWVEVVGLELNPAVPQAAITHQFLSWAGESTPIFSKLAMEHQAWTDRLKATLLIGDARVTIGLVQQSGFLADAVFLDPFSPPHCPQLWTMEFLERVSLCLCWDGRIATYSSAAAVRTALLATGLQIGSTPPVGRRSPGTVASWVTYDLPALSQQEQEHLHTRAAIPYRDPYLCDSATVILQRRQEEQRASQLEPASHWRKRYYSPLNN